MTKKYTPISCAVYDEYELAAIRKDELKVVLSNSKSYEGRIKTLISKEGIEYMILDSGHEFRLDEIKEVKLK